MEVPLSGVHLVNHELVRESLQVAVGLFGVLLIWGFEKVTIVAEEIWGRMFGAESGNLILKQSTSRIVSL